MLVDRDGLAAKLEVVRSDLVHFEQIPTYQRAQVFDQFTKREALERHPELGGAYKQPHNVKQSWTPQTSQDQQGISYFNVRVGLSEQLHRGRIPEGGVTVDGSRHVIDMVTSYQGSVVLDTQELKQNVKGEVAATSSRRALVEMSDTVIVRYEKEGLDRDVRVGEKVTIQHGSEKSQVYEQGKEPARENARDVGWDMGRQVEKRNMAVYQTGEQSIHSDDPVLSELLANIRNSQERPLCLYRTPGIEMYTTEVDGKYLVKRMPNSGSDHISTCNSYKSPSELSRLSQVIGSAIQENPDEGIATLKFDFVLFKGANRSAPTPNGKETGSVKTDGNKLTLRGILHYLWEEAGFNRWALTMAGKRSRYAIRKYLLQAVEDRTVKGASLAGTFYIPESLNAKEKNEITQ